MTPTDRFAPRDFLNVIDNEFLPVSGARAAIQRGSQTFETVWVPFFTPSRTPLLNQRWTSVPESPVAVVDGGAVIPRGSQAGIRWSRTGTGYDCALMFFDGFNHVPELELRPLVPNSPGLTPVAVEVLRTYPSIRVYGGDGVVPTRWFTVKAEAAYVTSPESPTD